MNISDIFASTGSAGSGLFGSAARSAASGGSAFMAAVNAFLEERSKSNPASRIAPSEAEITVLAKKYDPANMTEAQYGAFLQDLASLGALNLEDQEELSIDSLTKTLVSYTNEDGRIAVPEETEAMEEKSSGLSAVNGSLTRLLDVLSAVIPSGKQDSLNVLIDLTDRVRLKRDALELDDMDPEERKSSLRRLVSDSDSSFSVNLRDSIIENFKVSRKQREEEEQMEALTAILDNMTGRFDARVSAAAGIRLGLNADQSILQSGYLPTELHTYLLALGGNQPFEAVDDSDEETEKVKEVDGASNEKLFAGSERRRDLTEQDLRGLADQYDPHNMSREEYDRFLTELAAMGVLSGEEKRLLSFENLAESASQNQDAPVSFTAEAFRVERQLSPGPLDTDIAGWIERRVVWKPGLTRQSVKQQARLAAEQDVAVRIAEILADIQRQRYPSISL